MSDSPPPTAESLPPGFPETAERIWQAGDGTAVRLRPMHAGDLERELRFVAGLSRQTLYLRLQYSANGVSRDDLARLLELDYHDRMAIAALVGAAPADEIVGVSRYARIGDSAEAECAIVVADGWQGRGLGTELMRTLAQAARASGVHTLVGTSLAENQRIHDWARRFGFDVRTEPNSGGYVRITLDLDSLPS